MKRAALLCISSVVVLACVACKREDGGASAGKAAELAAGKDLVGLVTGYVQASNARDVARLKSLYAEDVVTEYVDHVPPERIEGRDALVDGSFQEVWKAIPDSYFEPTRVLIRGRELVVMSLATGTNTGPIAGIPPTNNPIGLLSAYHWTVNDQGQIVSEVVYMDQSTLPAQLGLLEHVDFRPVADATNTAPKIEIATDSAEERANVDTINRMIEAYNKHDPAEVMAFYSDTAVYSFMPAADDDRGARSIETRLRETFTMSPDIKATHAWIWGAGDFVTARTVILGTNDGPWPDGEQATGRRFKYMQLDVYKLVKGKITRHWSFANGHTMDVQLGFVAAE